MAQNDPYKVRGPEQATSKISTTSTILYKLQNRIADFKKKEDDRSSGGISPLLSGRSPDYLDEK